MEEVGAQVAPPIFIHQTLSSRFHEAVPMAKKRDLPYPSSNFQHQHPQRFQNPRDNWNPKVWDWDSVRFVANPLESELLRLGTATPSLRLKLGGGLSSIEEPVSRPSKRVRSGSPGSSSYPMCQVDNCREDLSNAKDYHRRHKVCEMHSKSTKALVGKQMQRFCQQCSRFHPLSEFDEGKRSCRRRLAGHNRRRRKTQPEDVSSRLLLPGNRDNTGNRNLDIVNLLTALARTQGNNEVKSANNSSVPDRDQLIQILSKLNSLPLPADFAAKLPISGSLNRNTPGQSSSEHQNRLNGKTSSPSTMDLLAVLSATLAASAPDALAFLSQRSSQSSDSEKTNYQSPMEDSDCQYFSSDSSNPMEERSPSSSPPVVQKLGADNGAVQSFPYQAGYTSSSGSDHSPSSLNSDAQDRTGRIIFKLFDKDPSHFPGTLRTEIYNWLAHSPSEMESYIRPGCVVLSVYASMSSAAWEQLEENLLHRVNSLVQDSDSDFWRNGRFLVHTGRELASHKDGKIRLCKSWRTWNSPELISVSPLAVVGGQETSFLLKGRNLANPGTKIHCTYMGGYTSKEVPGLARQGTVYDEISFGSFKINDAIPSVLGRCFIEVENGFRGNSFPVIVADATICKELRLLESEFDEEAKVSREEVLHFLNELGWLFQRKFSMLAGPDYSLARFKFLFTFSVERDCCALVKTLLDILVERNLGSDGLSSKSLETLSEVQLLSRAVKRRYRKMVDLLIHYSVASSSSKKYIFPPNLVGAGGITPLHLAACTAGSDDIIDALTSDPQEIGLHSWNSLLDASGQSPYAYAMMRNNHSYNRLVARKLADRRNGQVSLSIENAMEQPWPKVGQEQHFGQGRSSCAKCAVVAAKYSRRMPGSQGLLHRPYIHSMLAIAAVCVCVCLFLRGSPDIGLVAPFKWENLDYGTS
ncbi:unnamed protein product, partial [Vitis vinifera]